MTILIPGRRSGATAYHCNLVYKLELSVQDLPTIVVPNNVIGRVKFSIFPATPEEFLLIDFGGNPTVSSYALRLPSFALFVDYDWQGEVRAISESGDAISVKVREYASN